MYEQKCAILVSLIGQDLDAEQKHGPEWKNQSVASVGMLNKYSATVNGASPPSLD